jgi:hypothetical protein
MLPLRTTLDSTTVPMMLLLSFLHWCREDVVDGVGPLRRQFPSIVLSSSWLSLLSSTSSVVSRLASSSPTSHVIDYGEGADNAIAEGGKTSPPLWPPPYVDDIVVARVTHPRQILGRGRCIRREISYAWASGPISCVFAGHMRRAIAATCVQRDGYGIWWWYDLVDEGWRAPTSVTSPGKRTWDNAAGMGCRLRSPTMTTSMEMKSDDGCRDHTSLGMASLGLVW